MRVEAPAPEAVKACCAAVWSHPGVRLLLGDALHPGGESLTRRAIARLALPPGARVLDVGCGPGASAALLRAAGLLPIGVDLSAHLAAEAARREPAGRFLAGDAERLPLADRAADGALVECVLSTVPDRPSALAGIARALVPGGRLALSDVTVSGPLPAPLDTVLSWVACVRGGLPAGGYAALLGEAGFAVEAVEDRRDDLEALVRQARRRLALVQAALATGVTDLSAAGLDGRALGAFQELLGMAYDEVRAGTLGYVLLMAMRRPASGGRATGRREPPRPP